MSPLCQLSALQLARLVAQREVSCTEVVDAHLRRVHEVNPALNAIVHLLEDEARAAARQADAVVASGQPLPPLHGVPFTVKANIDMAGQPTTWGVAARCACRRDHRAAAGPGDPDRTRFSSLIRPPRRQPPPAANC